MFILKLAGKILLLPVWLILFVIGLAVKMTVQTYAVVRGILGFIFTLLIIATAYCYHDWVQVAFLFVLSTILYLILFAGVVVDTVLDMTRELSITGNEYQKNLFRTGIKASPGIGQRKTEKKMLFWKRQLLRCRRWHSC